MKEWIGVLLVVTCVAGVVFSVKTVGAMWLRAQRADIADASAHHVKCADARVAFFEDCYQWGRGRFECESLWAQKRGLVFDGSPTIAWTDEIDCSKETK